MRFSKNLTLCTLIGVAGLMSACTIRPYVPTLYDASSANVKTIALADNSIPDKMGANELSSSLGTGQAASGLIGAVVVAALEGAETSSRVNKLNDLMEPLNFDPEAEFEKMLTAKLTTAGYSGLDIIDAQRSNNGQLKLKSLPDTNSDAILDISMVSFGVQKARTGDEWRPAAGVKIQLLEASDQTVLMENMISYNNGLLYEKETEGFIAIEPLSSSVGYDKIKNMDPDVIRDETLVMLDAIADMIVTLL